jgi:hypothetical protein
MIASMPDMPENTMLVQLDDDTWLMIDEDGIPLGVWTWDDEEEIWIFDEDIPLGTLDMPVTGYTRLTDYLGFLGLLLLIAGLIIRIRVLNQSLLHLAKC